MRVAFDVTPLAGVRTGVGNLVAGFAEELRGHDELDLVLYAATMRGRTALSVELNTRIPPLPARLLRAMWLRTNWPPAEIWTGPVDIVHGMNYVVPPTRSAASLVSVHDLTVVRYPEMCTGDTLQYPTLLRRAFARGAHAHVDSMFVGEELASWSGLAPERIHVVQPGLRPIDQTATVDLSTTSADRLNAATGGRPFVLALGTVEPRKGYDTLVRAFAELTSENYELRLVIAGGDGWGAVNLAELMGRLDPQIASRIFRLGYVSEDEKAWLLRHARVLAYPSVYEGFGLPPLEAMQHGTPVVSSRAGSLPEVLGDAAVLVPVGDEHALGEEILRVHTNDDLRATLVASGIRQSAVYTWKRAGSEMANLYESIVDATRNDPDEAERRRNR